MSDDDGYVRLNAPAWEAERKVLAGRPERRASEVINGLTVDTAAFGTVPGGSAAAGRVTTWVDRSRTEMKRVVTEVTDLEQSTARARDLCLHGEAATTATANTATPR
jgi:hypothetical protein